ncbi:YopX family protein [Listeria innocua]|uniref:YopX family protein n=1 Tax=Listeria innocua TaxID=1642 RepID=UPI00165E21EC|nr:YopX family protein [Listeria innocua]
MREIEFRGKAIHPNSLEQIVGSWAYGGIFENKIISRNLDMDSQYHGFISEIEIDIETIGQYTGLKDKNGKKIFEGDIVTTFSNINKYTDAFAGDVEPTFYFTSIVCDGACFKTTYKGEPSYVLNQNVSSLVKHMEVIGNIHENPELLEGTE